MSATKETTPARNVGAEINKKGENAANETITHSPAFIEAERMCEKMDEITRETALKAFEYFRHRGGEFGHELEDWVRAENELLRPMPLAMTESADAITVTAAAPGFRPDDIEVSVDGDVLLISGHSELSAMTEDGQLILNEWKSDRLFRQIPLPSRVESDKVTAELREGILTLKLPKAPAQEAPRAAPAG